MRNVVMSKTERASDAHGSSPVDIARFATTPRLRGESAGGTRLPTLLARMSAMEFAVVACTAYFASVVYYRAILMQWPPFDQYISAAVLIATMVLLISLSFRNFAAIQAQSRLRFVWSGLGAVGLTFFFFLSAMFVLKVTDAYSRGTFFVQLVTVAIAVSMFRALAFNWLSSAIANGRVEASRLVIIGDDSNFTHILESLADEGVRIVSSFRFPTRPKGTVSGINNEIDLEAARDLVAACRAVRADDILIVPADAHVSKTGQLAAMLSELPASIHVIPVAAMDIFRTARLGELGTRATIQLTPRPLSFLDHALKRALDIVVSVAGLLLLSPLLLITAVAIRLDSAGPTFFRQKRHGYNNEPIQVLKFRTMTVAESGDAFKQVTKGDPRITGIGSFLRRTNIDELPQLINVLLGEMSIVGPRPHPIALNEQYERLMTPFMRRHNFKPGITGWAQVNGYRGETDTVDKMQRRLEYDLYYIDNWSFLFDIQILILTLLSKKAYTNAY